MQIQNLEGHVGMPLFERSSRGVTPTVAGRALYRHAIEILRALDGAKSQLAALAGEVTGTIRVGLMPTFTRGVLAPALARFVKEFANVEIAITEAYSAVLTDAVAAGDLDFAVVPSAPHREGTVSRHLGTDREMLVASAAAGLPHLQPVRFDSLAPLRLVLPARDNARRTSFDGYATANDISIGAVIDMDAMIATLEFVGNSDWMTILPATICLNDLDGTVRTLHPLVKPPLTVDYRVIEPAKRSLTPAAALFLSRIEEEYHRSDRRWAQILADIEI
jgi:DNA-binding transcriptional LysR family regulator